MSSRLFQLFMAGALCALLSQCEKSTPSVSAGEDELVLATVAGLPVTEKDLLAEVEWRTANRQTVPELDELLDEVIKRRALLARARSEGVETKPDVQRRMEAILIANVRERELGKAVAEATISDEELKAAYEQRSAALSSPPMDRFAILFMEASEKVSDTKRAEVRRRLEEGLEKSDSHPAPGGRGPAAMGFGAYAAEYSDDQLGRYRGGDIGWVKAGDKSARVPDEVLEVGRHLSEGKRSDIIATPVGFYVIMKTDSRAGGLPPFEDLSAKLHHELLVEKRRSIEARFLQGVIDGAEVSIDQSALSQVALPEIYKDTERQAPAIPPAVPNPSASR